MNIVWGVTLVILGALAWGGQTMSWLAPKPAARLGLTEEESAVEPVFWADVRGEAAWDSLTLWPLVVAGCLLIVDSPSWSSWGAVGGGVYLYFAGRGVLTRAALLRRGFRVGNPANVTSAFVALSVWGLTGAVTIVASLVHLN